MIHEFAVGDQVRTKKGWPEAENQRRTGVIVAVTGGDKSNYEADVRGEKWVIVAWDDAPKPCVNRMDIAHTHLELNPPQTPKRLKKS